MGGWDIDPGGVQGVVQKTAHVAQGFEKELKTYGHNLSSAASNGGSGIVAKALNDFAAHHKSNIQGMINQTTRSLTGAVNATKAYVRGDLEMAANAQRNASAASGGHRGPR